MRVAPIRYAGRVLTTLPDGGCPTTRSRSRLSRSVTHTCTGTRRSTNQEFWYSRLHFERDERGQSWTAPDSCLKRTGMRRRPGGVCGIPTVPWPIGDTWEVLWTQPHRHADTRSAPQRPAPRAARWLALRLPTAAPQRARAPVPPNSPAAALLRARVAQTAAPRQPPPLLRPHAPPPQRPAPPPRAPPPRLRATPAYPHPPPPPPPPPPTPAAPSSC
jgi:hypothetical protein